MTLSDERPSATTRIAVIQGNLPQEIRGRPDFRVVNVQNHVRLTEDAIRSTHPSLIIWPEVAAQGSFRLDLYLNQTIARLAQTTHTYFLIGSAERPKYGQTPLRTTKSFNSAFLVSPQGRILGQYNKLHLLPFSEYLPYEEVIPWPARYRASTAYFTPGREYTVFQLDDLRFGTTICWEAIFPDMFRRFVGQGVDFMVNITNEVLFGETAAPHQFLSMVVFRAVENHVAIARSAYTGVSGFIDPQGRIIGTVNRGGKETFVEGHLTAALPLSRQRTFYTAYGDVFAYLCQAAVALAFLRRVALTRRALTGNRAPQSL
jgi:apolipoprotein N-acyltransferase